MNYINCRIGKDGLYMSSKTPQPGYTETKYGVNMDKVTYKKNIDKIEGVVTYFMIDDITFDGKTVKLCKISLKDGDTLSSLAVNLENKSGNYTDEFTKLVSAMNAYKVGEKVTLTVSHKKYTNKKGEEKKSLNIILNYVNILGDNGKPLWTGFIPYEEIPKPVAENKRDSVVWNWEAAMDFWWAKYTEVAKRVRDYAQQNDTTENNAPAANSDEKPSVDTVSTPSGAVSQPADDLPF